MRYLWDLNALALQNLPSWWEKIDSNSKWQEWSFVGLAIGYGLIALVALVQLVRWYLGLGLGFRAFAWSRKSTKPLNISVT